MSAEVIDFPTATLNPGNGAREALIDTALTFANTSEIDAQKWADYILAEFWVRGFKVIPVKSN